VLAVDGSWLIQWEARAGVVFRFSRRGAQHR
jgi:hypothetical protein